MPKLSPARENWPLLPELKLLTRGKVRDCYLLPCGKILQVATDAISIFDFILNALVPMKGYILTAMSIFWFKKLESFGIKTHLVAYGSGIDAYLPEELRNNTGLQSRAIVVENLDMVDDVEFIFRAVLTGSSLKPYNETGMVCGQELPEGLQDGDALPFILDSPSTKAQEGHDVHVLAQEIRAKYPLQTYLGLKIFQIAQDHAAKCGIKLADTKFEFGKDGTLADEVLTPDASRFWEYSVWEAGRKEEKRKAPPPYDKQLVRAWGITRGINELDAKDPANHDKVHQLVVPQQLICATTQTYRYIFWRMARMKNEKFRREEMGIQLPADEPKRVLIICGSESDYPDVKPVCCGVSGVCTTIDIMSCHRNPSELMDAIKYTDPKDFNAIIGVGGKALALPGVIDAWVHYFKKNIPVVGVALGEEGSESLLAAQLSIRELPGQPVIIDETTGKVYTGRSGLRGALLRIRDGELPPPKQRKEKPIQFNV